MDHEVMMQVLQLIRQLATQTRNGYVAHQAQLLEDMLRQNQRQQPSGSFADEPLRVF